MNHKQRARAATRHYSCVLINAARAADREIVAPRPSATRRAATAPSRV
jgi:hypothetical protein